MFFWGSRREEKFTRFSQKEKKHHFSSLQKKRKKKIREQQQQQQQQEKMYTSANKLFEDALVEEEPTSTPPVPPFLEGGGGEEREEEEEELEEEGTMTTMAGLLGSEEGRGIHVKLEPFLDQFKHAVDELERECALIAENAKADADECAREAFKMLRDLERKSEEMKKKNIGTRQDICLIKEKSSKAMELLTKM